MRRYSDVYTQLFRRIHTRSSSDVHRWVANILSDTRRPLSHTVRLCQHLQTIERTQGIAARLHPRTVSLIHSRAKLLRVRWVAFHLRPLQRRVLHRLYRPEGPMYARSLEEMLKPTPGAESTVGGAPATEAAAPTARVHEATTPGAEPRAASGAPWDAASHGAARDAPPCVAQRAR